jgi:hypothetical protein
MHRICMQVLSVDAISGPSIDRLVGPCADIGRNLEMMATVETDGRFSARGNLSKT